MFQNHFFFFTGVIVEFRFRRLRNKLRSSTFENCELTAGRALRAIFNISSDEGEEFFGNGKLDTKSEGENKRKAVETTQGRL